MSSEINRKQSRKEVIPGVWVPVIDEITFNDPTDRGQETTYTYFNTPQNTLRAVKVVAVGDDPSTPPDVDDSSAFTTERILQYNTNDPVERGQESIQTLTNNDVDDNFAPKHFKVQYIRYCENNDPDGAAFVDVQQIIKLRDLDSVDRGQERLFTLTGFPPADGDPIDDPGDPFSPVFAECDMSLPIVDHSNTAIDPPWRLDPWQNIVRVVRGYFVLINVDWLDLVYSPVPWVLVETEFNVFTELAGSPAIVRQNPLNVILQGKDKNDNLIIPVNAIDDSGDVPKITEPQLLTEGIRIAACGYAPTGTVRFPELCPDGSGGFAPVYAGPGLPSNAYSKNYLFRASTGTKFNYSFSDLTSEVPETIITATLPIFDGTFFQQSHGSNASLEPFWTITIFDSKDVIHYPTDPKVPLRLKDDDGNPIDNTLLLFNKALFISFSDQTAYIQDSVGHGLYQTTTPYQFQLDKIMTVDTTNHHEVVVPAAWPLDPVGLTNVSRPHFDRYEWVLHNSGQAPVDVDYGTPPGTLV